MASHKKTDLDLLVKYSRLSVYFALALLLALGTYAVLIHVFPDSNAAAMAHRLAVMLPIAIVIALAALRSSLHGVSAHPREAAVKALHSDEWRAQALSRAYRNGLIAVLVVQPLLVLALAAAALPFPLVPMASATVLIGVATVLCSLLAYDR
ncbi:MAG: hypothetical protein V4631_16250 [Pseudomonadota bacterium]